MNRKDAERAESRRTRSSVLERALGALAVFVSASFGIVACDGDPTDGGGGPGSGGGSSASQTSVVAPSSSGTGGALPDSFEVSGLVIDQDGAPVDGAIVMQGGGQPGPTTGADGAFTVSLTSAITGERVVVAAKVGYRSVGVAFTALPTEGTTLVLYEVEAPDNTAYIFRPPGVGDQVIDNSTEFCGHCHTTFVRDFQQSAHARATRDPIVQDLYSGVASAVTSQATCSARGGVWRTGVVPGAPSQTAARCYVGDGALPDLNGQNGCGGSSELACDDPALPLAQQPTAFGACADCHALGMDGPAGGRNLLEATGIAYENGNHCDACHHVRDVDLTKAPGSGGRLIMQRPREKIGDPITGPIRQAMFGPFPDVPNPFMGGSYQPKFKTAEFCAGCHEQLQPALLPGSSLDVTRWPGGLPTHSTYTEWQEGPFPAQGKPCQECHMPPVTSLFNPEDYANAGNAGIVFGFGRAPEDIRSHAFRGPLTVVPGVPRLIDGAVSVEIAATPAGSELFVDVTLTNVACGHAIPTGEPMRALVLVVGVAGCGGPFGATAGQTIDDAGGARASGTLGVDATLAGTSLTWAAQASNAQVGQVVRIVRPSGTYLDYDGVGLFAGTTLTPQEKGVELTIPVGEAAIAMVAGSILELSTALVTSPGDRVMLADPTPSSFVDGDPSRALAGASGATYARVLTDPSGRRRVPHHRAIDIVVDNRIRPQVSASSSHTFAIPAGCTAADVRATVLYRPLPLTLATERAWDARDYVVSEATSAITLP